MKRESYTPVSISAQDVQATTGKLKLLLFTPKERMIYALAGLVCAWLLAIAALFIPIAHFVLVPLLLIAGPSLAYRLYQRKQQAVSLDGQCPKCLQNFEFEVDKALSFPYWEVCPHCNLNMQLARDEIVSTDTDASAEISLAESPQNNKSELT